MAKGSNVFYKLPIEEMRGKLATKQDGIMYAGQTEGENTLAIGSGFHQAKNFEKYIVLTRTRGKNRFYVKSRTTVANTVGTINTRAILALAMPLVDAMYARKDDSVQMDGLKIAYEYYQKGETLREYLTRIVVDTIRNSATTITYQSKPNAQGIAEMVTLMGNPYAAYNTQGQNVLGISNYIFGKLTSEKKIIQEYLKYRALQMGVSRINIRLHDTIYGGTYTFALLAINDVTTFAQLNGTTQSEAFRIISTEEAITNITIIPFNKNYMVAGQPFLDEAKTQPLTPTAKISAIADLYI